MSEHFNKLTPAEHERLSLLMEECAEVIAVCGKIMRHGYDSCDPTKKNSPTNRRLLIQELGDVAAAQDLLVDGRELIDGEFVCSPIEAVSSIERHKVHKLYSVKKWMHHQEQP